MTLAAQLVYSKPKEVELPEKGSFGHGGKAHAGDEGRATQEPGVARTS